MARAADHPPTAHPDIDPWPDPIRASAFHGPAGEFVGLLAPHTEADEIALLIQFLAFAGSILGRGPTFRVEGDVHRTNLFAVLVGQSSKARKGTSLSRVRQLFGLVDPDWLRNCVTSGLSSGEGLIHRVRDAGTGRSEDEGVEDKRLLVIEPEFAQVLRLFERTGNTLSAQLRNAWDGLPLGTLTKKNNETATDPHISILGHTTQDEVLRYLVATEMANGFANRFLWLCVRRARLLPEGGHIPVEALRTVSTQLRGVLERGSAERECPRDSSARDLWISEYERLSQSQPGLLGAILGRGEAQVMRLALLYAVLDGDEAIRPVHLEAALAVWDYAERSARFLFARRTGDRTKDRLLRFIRDAGAEGVTRTGIRDHFHRHERSDVIEMHLGELEALNYIRRGELKGRGRTAEVWFPVAEGRDQATEATKVTHRSHTAQGRTAQQDPNEGRTP